MHLDPHRAVGVKGGGGGELALNARKGGRTWAKGQDNKTSVPTFTWILRNI